MWICLFATIIPSFNSNVQFGQITVIGADPFKSQDSLIGAGVHSFTVSQAITSTCVCFLYGPRTLTFAISDFGHLIMTHSSDAN
jgi:hypothetical protein